MIIKYLEKKVELQTEIGGPDIDGPIELEYYMLESEADGFEEIEGSVVYGIEIIKKKTSENGPNIESRAVRNLCCCRKKAEEILESLVHNAVTPGELTFILDDMIGIQI